MFYSLRNAGLVEEMVVVIRDEDVMGRLPQGQDRAFPPLGPGGHPH